MKILKKKTQIMNYNLDEYNAWFEQNVRLSNAYSVDSLKEITYHILMGKNYRLITENNTKSKLLYTYAWLSDIVTNARNEFGDNWKEDLFTDLVNTRRKTNEQKNLLYWLLGLTAKTSVNLSISNNELPEVLRGLIEHVTSLFQNIGREEQINDAWLLMMAGSATLNIRGSDKSKVGKSLEKVLIKSALTILGLEYNVNFWTNIQRDREVDRESDAEIQTQRGRIRVEVGLISSGNQEVTEDKIGRVGRNGIILFDKVGRRTRIYETADRYSVKLIQIRNNQPLVELYRHINPLVNFELNNPPQTEEAIKNAVYNLPDEIFQL